MMQLIGVGERRYFGRGTVAVAIFRKDSGEEFDLPVTFDQMVSLLAEAGQMQGQSPAQPAPVTRTRQPQPAPSADFRSSMEDDEDELVEGLDTIRLAQFAGGGVDDFDDGDRL